MAVPLLRIWKSRPSLFSQEDVLWGSSLHTCLLLPMISVISQPHAYLHPHPSSQANDPVPLTHVLPDGQILLLLYIQHNLQAIASATLWSGEQLCPVEAGVEGVALPHSSEDLGAERDSPSLNRPLGVGALPSFSPFSLFLLLGFFFPLGAGACSLGLSGACYVAEMVSKS